MEEKITLDESMVTEDVKEETREEVIQEELPKIQPRKNRNDFKEKECRVIAYSKKNNILDVDFGGYGIRLNDVKDFEGNVAVVKYKGEIGKPNFDYKL